MDKLTEAERASSYRGLVKQPPKPLALKPIMLTIEDLFTAMYNVFEIDEDEVRGILRNAGYSNFKAKYWDKYFDLVREHKRTKEALFAWPEFCPICEGDIVRDRRMDYKFGAKFGWKCIKDGSHFFAHRVNEWRENFRILNERAGGIYNGRT